MILKINVWWDAEVVGLDATSEDKSNPNYFIWYEDCGTMDKENLEGQEYYLKPLLDDYLNHCVQVLSLDLDQDEIKEWSRNLQLAFHFDFGRSSSFNCHLEFA